MSIVIVIAPTADTATAAWASLRQADLADAAPSRREQLTPQQVQQLMLKTVQQRRGATTPKVAHMPPQGPQIVLEKIWTELATDLVLGNVDHAQFGWCQTLDEHTPAFWQRFDPETRFVLVYEEPTAYAARVIAQDHAQAQDLSGTLQHWHSQHSQLINTFYALGADAVLVHASQMQSAAVALGLTASENTPQTVAHALHDAQLLTQLLQPMVSANAQVQTLWQELQAASQGTWQEPLPPLEAANQALGQSLEQRHTLATLQQQRLQLEQAQQRLQSELAAQMLTHQSELAAQMRAHQSELAAKRDAQMQFDACQQQLAQKSQQYKAAQEEGELLLAQLHQVQEELEQYFIKYQEQRHQYQAVAEFWCQHTPAEVWFDMRRTPDGAGWYEAETDGRWSGPTAESTVDLPPLAAGDYLLELHIADAMAPELVAGLQLSVVLCDGETVPVEMVHEFGPAESLYPMVSAGMLSLPATHGGWQLRLALPEVISPAAHGGNDTRHLGLRLQGLRLTRRAHAAEDAEAQA